MARLSVKMDARNLQRRLKYINDKIDKNGMATVRDTAKIIQSRSAILAPKKTRKLVEFIKVIPVNGNTVKEALVGYENMGFGVGNPHPDRRWGENAEFSLPFWMQPDMKKSDSSKANRHFTSGKRDFLIRAADMTRREFKERTVRMVRNALQTRVK